MNTKSTIAAILAASIAAAGAANQNLSTVGTINGNGKTLIDATGDTVGNSTFASDIVTAFVGDTGGVWNFDTAFSAAFNADTITLSYGTSQTSSEVLTLGQGAGDNINQGNVGGEATSGAFEMGLGNTGTGTRVFNLSVPLLELGIISLNRGDASRTSVLTVTFQDTTTASTSGANGGNTYFQGFKTTEANPIVSFSLSQNNFIRYDDLGFVAAPVPEPGTAVLAGLGGLALLAGIRRRR